MTAAAEDRATLAGIGRRLASQPVAQTFAATVAINALNVMTGVILARALGPLGRGELAAAILWPTLLRFVVMLGGQEAIAYRAARPNTRMGQLIGTAAGLAALQDVVLVIAGIALLPVILSGFSDTTLVASFIFLATVSIGTFGMYQLAIFNGARRYAVFNGFRVGVVAIAAVVMLVLAVLDALTVQTAVLCYLAGVAPTTALGLVWLKRMFGRFERPDRRLRRSLLSYGWRTQLSSTRNPLNEQLDQYAVSIFLSPVELGLYAVAYTVTTVIAFFSASIAVVALPSTARSDDAEAQHQAARRHIGMAFGTSVAIAIPLALIAGPLIEVVFGDRFSEAASTTRILLGAAVVVALTRVAASVLNGLGRPGEAGIAGLLSLAGTAAGLAFLIGPHGLDGAALATAAGYGVSSIWCLWRVGKALSISPLMVLVPVRRR